MNLWVVSILSFLYSRVEHCWETLFSIRHQPATDRYRDITSDPRSGELIAESDDPQMILRSRAWIPGWYMLEATVLHATAARESRLYLNEGQGYTDENSVSLPIKNGRVSKRIVHVAKSGTRLRFDPVDAPGNFSVEHLRLILLTPGFARDRIRKRVMRLHHDFRGMSLEGVSRRMEAEYHGHGYSTPQQWLMACYAETFHNRRGQGDYQAWIAVNEMPVAEETLARKPLISILVPVYRPEPGHFRACIESVLAQSYRNLELCLVDDASGDEALTEVLEEYRLRDDRVRVAVHERNQHISHTSNTALEMASGDFIALLDHDDVLAPQALYFMAQAINKAPEAMVFYSDEDKLDEKGRRHDPHFKSGWNPDLLLSQNYLSHLGVYSTSLVRQSGGFRAGYEGSQDHDLALRVTRDLSASQIVHIPRVLYHWRAGEGSTALDSGAKDYTSQAGLKAVRDYVAQASLPASVTLGSLPNTYRVTWPVRGRPLVSLIVPTRDGVDILKPCVEALLERTTYTHFELLILDNQSTCEKTLTFMQEVSQRDSRVRVLQWNHPFNYSAINNFGVSESRGEIIGLINNDIEPINADWLDEMVGQVQREEIGCVGAKLYYPNNTVQHAGVILGIGGVAGHAHKYFHRTESGYFSRLMLTQNLSAVTAACLLVRREVFEAVGGLNEAHLAVAFNDVDFCLKVREAGYRNLWTPLAELYHHESVSRGQDDNPEKQARAQREVSYMLETWGEQLTTDPYYNPNLTLVHEDFSLR
ncbi:MAG: glycosyl transferase family 2 [Cobetia sp.]|uniref:glycosyltransferase family 2 protein n=1 Tax=Cobetia sp. TaxID=1873876 RepID=UPI000C46D73B|nr:glycosyltransferase family 2 protein [Cobetia sp.]MBF09329.1 glycosyl transferase family 2 [Cobetia sp.]|tara:strand:+ start:18559 stop:20838 length:2280 start_codon:yes stop_codon:yes gene_type:complete